MKINKKGYLMKLILGYNLNAFDPTEVEITEEKVTFQEHCSQVAANWSCKSINSMITVMCKLLFYMLKLELMNYKHGRRFNYLKCIREVEMNRENMTCKIIIESLQVIISITPSPKCPHITIVEVEIPGFAL